MTEPRIHIQRQGSLWTACGWPASAMKTTTDIIVANCVPCLENRRDHHAGMAAAIRVRLEQVQARAARASRIPTGSFHAGASADRS